jgi:hypothetical protein
VGVIMDLNFDLTNPKGIERTELFVNVKSWKLTEAQLPYFLIQEDEIPKARIRNDKFFLRPKPSLRKYLYKFYQLLMKKIQKFFRNIFKSLEDETSQRVFTAIVNVVNIAKVSSNIEKIRFRVNKRTGISLKNKILEVPVKKISVGICGHYNVELRFKD